MDRHSQSSLTRGPSGPWGHLSRPPILSSSHTKAKPPEKARKTNLTLQVEPDHGPLYSKAIYLEFLDPTEANAAIAKDNVVNCSLPFLTSLCTCSVSF